MLKSSEAEIKKQNTRTKIACFLLLGECTASVSLTPIESTKFPKNITAKHEASDVPVAIVSPQGLFFVSAKTLS